MNRLKEYKNLYGLYQRNQRKTMIPFIIIFFLLLPVVVFVVISSDEPLFFLIMAFYAVIILISFLLLRRGTMKSLNYFTDEELTRIDSDILTIQMQDGFGVTSDAVICGKGGLILYPVRHVLWIYKSVATTTAYRALPLSRNTYVVIAGKDHKRFAAKTKNKSNVLEFLQKELQQYRQGIFYGYSDQLDTLFSKDIDRMIAMSEEYETRNK